MTAQDLSDRSDKSIPETGYRGGSIGMVLVVAFILIGAVIGTLLLGRSNAQPYILVLLAVLAMIGVFSVFAIAAGLLQFSAAHSTSPLLGGLVDSASDGVVVTDQSGRVVYANRAYLTLIGATDISDARPVERVFIGDPDVSEAVYRLVRAAREGRRLQEEVRLRGGNDMPARWLRLIVRSLESPTGRNSVWSVADITRDRERQENVFQELQHAIDYLDHAPAGFFSVDANGDIVYLNASLANWLDYDLAQVGAGGLKLSDIVSGDGSALLTSMPISPGDVRTEVHELDLKTRTGKPLPVRLFHKVAFGADGTPGASRTLVLNRARDENADPLRAAEVRFMRFFHNTPMAIATIDRSGRIVRANVPFALLFHGVLKGEMGSTEGRSISAVAANRERSGFEAAISQGGEGQGEIAPFDVALAGEGDRSARFWVTPIDENDRDGEAAIVYALETTEQRALEAQFAQSQKMQAVGQLAGGIAHDFNNVLSAIMMATDFLLTAHRPTDPSFSDIQQIKQNANRAASLVRQLLAFSRRQTLRPQVLDLGEALSDLGMLLRRLLGEKIVLDVSHGRDLWPVKADISQFEQVIVNLAVNARDAMPDGGKLSLRTANISETECDRYAYKGMPRAEYVLVEVTDAGTGIPLDVMDKIFEPFFSTKEVGKGTGLGLSMVYGIIKQTGGFVYPESEVGRGTTFRIFLPRHFPDPDTLEDSAPPPIAPADSKVVTDLTGKGTILLVEDEEGLRALNARGLTSRGYTVLVAGNGAEAIEVFNANAGKIDLIVSDVVMPEMDGPTLLKELRRDHPDIRFIFVSGYAEEAFEKNLPAGGQFAFLPKPFTLKQLVAAVKETMI